jgi:glycosidase
MCCMKTNPKLYEINSRVWIKQFKENPALNGIDVKFFEDLKKKGIDIIWMMGIWNVSKDLVKKCCFESGLLQSYNKSLKDWTEEDVIGSPFAITDYSISDNFGSKQDLINFKKKLNDIGLKLVLDFIPNHFGADSNLIKTNPEIFLEADEETFLRDSHTYFKLENGTTKYFAHGRDPLFPAWRDTIQVNHFSREARIFLTKKLKELAEVCDGVRCDMAMLPLNNVFHNTWMGVINKQNIKKPADEFWTSAIKEVKKVRSDFIFIAEAYWDLEWDLQQLGFDFTYDKRLTDRLLYNDIPGAKAHLQAEMEYQKKSVRFIENHDEPRAASSFGKQKSMAAAAIISTIPGVRFYYDGQFEGKKIKLPVQLGREPEENGSKTLNNFYNKLLNATNDEIFDKGEWKYLETTPAHPDDHTFENLFAWQWKLENELRIVVINYSDAAARCRLKFNLNSEKDQINFTDLMSNKKYNRSVEDILEPGMFIELGAYQCHIFAAEL